MNKLHDSPSRKYTFHLFFPSINVFPFLIVQENRIKTRSQKDSNNWIKGRKYTSWWLLLEEIRWEEDRGITLSKVINRKISPFNAIFHKYHRYWSRFLWICRVYYKCNTVKGCPARKRIELSLTDSKMLLVTYDREHRHHHTPTPVPASFSGLKIHWRFASSIGTLSLRTIPTVSVFPSIHWMNSSCIKKSPVKHHGNVHHRWCKVILISMGEAAAACISYEDVKYGGCDL